MTLTWKAQLEKILLKQNGKKKQNQLSEKYAHAFPSGYMEQYPAEMAASDIIALEKLSDKNPLEISLYYAREQEPVLHLRLFQWQKPISLSDILPMLENLNLRTDSEQPFKLHLTKHQFIWISDFAVIYPEGKIELNKVKELFEDAFIKIYFGMVENDGFNKLILGALISWREISILRAYVKYLRQVRFRFSQVYIEKALVDNACITKDLIALFDKQHNPLKNSKNKSALEKIEKNILDALAAVQSLDEDIILRRLFNLIKATLRTNYYQQKEYISLKLNSRLIPELPLPMPLYEIFVYSPRFEGIHLRNAKVARGGIRWSDRLEDFRTEVLGLMKAQVVKNAVIVPSGAKGGFVLKKVSAQTSAAELQKEVIYCYKEFIRGLLDLTDNIKDNKFISPKNVVCYDDVDAYLVVAADKGTATFSDMANEISIENDFWLGDAFASGGKTGYDHKKIGITARGTWESIKRHFRELDTDAVKTTLTVVGIGDMSGDVFGNGMLYSKQIKLLACFDHRHIFLDPDPVPLESYAERLRLYNLPASSWANYNPSLISKGGGVFKRSEKSIAISAPVKLALQIEENTLSPNDLIKAILKAPVDLLFNGGIGTYVKAKSQSHADVGDRTNDDCRIDGADLRCKVVGEGGNLGFTQLGRIEYAFKGGLLNTDFIDNSAGVDCSDHEVNLKILLDSLVRKGQLSEKKRNYLLAKMTDEVADLVLKDNYEQALVMSFSAYHAKNNMSLHTDYIRELENAGIINREVEALPTNKALLERKAMGAGLTRPELAVLLAYTKIHVKHQLLESDLLEDPYLRTLVETAFPPEITKNFTDAMYAHRLHRDIIATQISNKVINEMGMTFVYRLQMETGSTVDEIIRAHAVASHIFGTQSLQKLIESLDYKISMSEQYEMLYNIRNLINLGTRWFLHTAHVKENLQTVIDHFSARIKILEKIIPSLMGGLTKEYLENLLNRFLKLGLSKDTAQRIATCRAIYTSLNIIEVATKNNFDLVKTAKVYFEMGERINLLWFRDQISHDTREGHWNTLARLTLRDELDIAQRLVTIAILSKDGKEKNGNVLIDKWMQAHQRVVTRWERMLNLLHSSDNVDYVMFFIAIRELIGLIHVSLQT